MYMYKNQGNDFCCCCGFLFVFSLKFYQLLNKSLRDRDKHTHTHALTLSL